MSVFFVGMLLALAAGQTCPVPPESAPLPVVLFVNLWSQSDGESGDPYGNACSAIYADLLAHASTSTALWTELVLHVGPWTINRDEEILKLTSGSSDYTQVWVCDLSERGAYVNYDGHESLMSAIASWRTAVNADLVFDGRLVDHVANPNTPLLTGFYDAFTARGYGLYSGTGGEEFFTNAPSGTLNSLLNVDPYVVSTNTDTSGYITDTSSALYSVAGDPISYQAAKPSTPLGLQGNAFSGAVLYPFLYLGAAATESVISTTLSGGVGWQVTASTVSGLCTAAPTDTVQFNVDTATGDAYPGTTKRCSWVEFKEGESPRDLTGGADLPCTSTADFNFTSSGPRVIRVRAYDEEPPTASVGRRYAEDFYYLDVTEVKPTAETDTVTALAGAANNFTLACTPNAPSDPLPFLFFNAQPELSPMQGLLLLQTDSETEPPPQVLEGGKYLLDVQYVADLCAAGVDTFDYYCGNQLGSSDPQTITINVTPIPTPVAPTLAFSVRQFGDLVDTLASPEEDYTYALAGAASNGFADVNEDGTFIYTPVSEFTGSDSFTYTVSDSCRTSAAATVTVTIVPNNKPVPVELGNATGYVNAEVSGVVTGTDSDVGDVVSFSIATQPSDGVVVIDAVTGAFTFTPTTHNFIGYDRFLYRVNDGFEDSETDGIVELDVINRPPYFDGSVVTAYTVNSGGVISGSPVAMDDDVNQNLTYSLLGSPTGGVTLSAAGTFTYTAPGPGPVKDSIVVRANDGLDSSEPLVVTISITQPEPIPPPPPALSSGAVAGIAIASVVFGCCCIAALANFGFRMMKLQKLKNEIAKYESVRGDDGDELNAFGRN